MKGEHILTGTAGAYFVMHRLAIEGFHASATHGNAPCVDILACSETGGKSVAIQVKTTKNATRFAGRGQARQVAYLDFPLSKDVATVGQPSAPLITFVDLRIYPGVKTNTPDVYIYPVAKVRAAFDQTKVGLSPMVRFLPRIADAEKYKNRWNLIARHLSEEVLPADTDDVEFVRLFDDAGKPFWYPKPLTKAGESVAAGFAQDASRVWPAS